MRHLRFFILCATFAGLVFWAGLDASAQTQTSSIAPQSYTTLKGADGGQPAATLAARDQEDGDDDPTRYVEFTTPRSKYRGYRVYELPQTIDPGATIDLRVQANFKGPTRARQAWTWRIFNYRSSRWEKIGDNGSVADGVWSAVEFAVDGAVDEYVDPATRQLRVRLDSKGSSDDAKLDFEAVVVRTPACDETLAARGSGPTYYVSTTGDDANPGTAEAPWRTIQKAARTAVAGSTVFVRGGVYNEAVTIAVSGNETAGPITFRNAPCEVPIVDGSGLTVPDSPNGLFLVVNQSYVVIAGFELRNYASSRRDIVPVGIHVRGTSHHIEIRNNRIHAIATHVQTRTGGDAHAIGVFGTEAPASIHDLVIDGNEIFDLELGSSEAVALNGNVERFAVTNNVVHDANNIGLDFIGFEETAPDPAFDQARDGVVAGNLVYNIDSFGNPAYGQDRSAGGIYVDGGRDILIERNTVHHADIGIELASEHFGRATRGVTLRNNFLYANLVVGISIGGYDDERGSTEACTIVNNTLVGNDTFDTGTGEINLQFDSRDCVLANNLLVATSQGIFLSNAFVENSGNRLDFNCYFTTGQPTWQWKNRVYTSLDALRAGAGVDLRSFFADPKLVDRSTPRPSIATDSPAVDAGDGSVDVGAQDIDGEQRIQGANVDIGADEVR